MLHQGYHCPAIIKILTQKNENKTIKASFFVREPNPAYVIHGKKGSFLKPRGDVQEDDLKVMKKPNLDSWGTEPMDKEGFLHTEIDGRIMHGKIPTLQGNYYDFFDGVYNSIVNDTAEPVTAEDGAKVMQIIEAAILSNNEKRVVDL